MLVERRPGEFSATCDTCEASSGAEPSREHAILKLMRSGWRVRMEDGETRTWCAECQTSPSIPVVKPSGDGS
jgi:hypothetical protein